jgi:ParB family chromosome partitioning protein
VKRLFLQNEAGCYEAAARRADRFNFCPSGTEVRWKTSRELLATDSPDSNTQIQRYIRLTSLHPSLLDMVDDGKIAIRPAVEISYLAKEERKL